MSASHKFSETANCKTNLNSQLLSRVSRKLDWLLSIKTEDLISEEIEKNRDKERGPLCPTPKRFPLFGRGTED